MLRNLVRIFLAGAVYLAGALVVLVSMLAVWSSYHHTLRGFGSPIFVLCLFSVCFGVPVFWAATAFVRRVLIKSSGLAFHFMSAAALYIYALVVVVGITTFAPKDGLEGGDIAIRLSLIVVVLGVVVNAFSAWREITKNPTSTVLNER